MIQIFKCNRPIAQITLRMSLKVRLIPPPPKKKPVRRNFNNVNVVLGSVVGC